MAYFVVESHVKKLIHEADKQISPSGLAALDRVVEAILTRAITLTNHHTRIAGVEIEVAAGVSELSIKPKGRR